MNNAPLMKLRRPAVALLVLALGFLPAACGSKKSGGEKHGETAQAPESVPTPDTTPIEVLRTPAGLVLKPEQAQPTPAPAVSPAAEPTKPAS